MEQPATPKSAGLRRWLLPSLTQWLWLVLLLVLLVQPWRTRLVASDGDACMHWAVGEWMLAHRQLLRADVFSHTKFGEPIISKEWLSQILYAAAGRAGGLDGLAVLAALLIATTFALLHRQLLREANGLLVSTVIVLLAAWASSNHWLARPHAFSFLIALLWNDALRRFVGVEAAVLGGRGAATAAGTAATTIALCLLTLLWVNLHGAFLAGFLILGAHCFGAALERDWRTLRRLGLIAAACALVSLLNPGGFKLHLHNIEFLRSKMLTDWLAEYRSPDFHSPESRGLVAWLALMFCTLALARPKIRAGDAALLISWTYFALYAARNVPLLAVVSAPIIARALSDALDQRVRPLAERLRRVFSGCNGWPVTALGAAAAIVLLPQTAGMPESRWPVAAVDFIKQNPDRFTGNMFNQYIWGGYLMHALPGHRVFVDGRTDFYGEDLIRQFDELAGLGTNWTQVLRQHDVRWTLMPTEHRLNQALALLADWQCVYSNGVATIFASRHQQTERCPTASQAHLPRRCNNCYKILAGADAASGRWALR